MKANNRHTGETPTDRLRALVVDDCLEAAQPLLDYLEADGRYEVVSTASNGRMAVELVAQLSPDVVLMDMRMPEMDGLEATRQIKSRPPAPTVFLLTLDDTPSCRVAAKAADADGFISKTDLFTELPRALGALRQRRDVEGEAPPSAVAAACAPNDPPLR